jgi:hypothetical protein
VLYLVLDIFTKVLFYMRLASKNAKGWWLVFDYSLTKYRNLISLEHCFS